MTVYIKPARSMDGSDSVECDGNKWHGGKNGCDRDRNRDKFLIKIASAIKDTFVGDLIARQGDDHFVVFTDEESFMPKIEKSYSI